MAKTARSKRTDPKSNKSLAVRLTLEKMPNATAAEIADAVKKAYGHTIPTNVVYMVKTKKNVKPSRKASGKVKSAASPSGASQWVSAIKAANQLLRVAGDVETSVALLRAIAADRD